MVQEARNLERFSLAEELNSALTGLESALAEAGRSAGAIRSLIPQIVALADLADQMETAMTNVRRQHDGVAAVDEQPVAPPPQLRPVAPSPLARGTADASPSRCLRIDVRSKSGALDLRAVDRSVNESPAVVDVALLEYDGSHASLKVWVGPLAAPPSVRETLLESLGRHLAEQGEVEVQVEFEVALG